MSARSFAITADTKPLALGEQGSGEIAVTAANTTTKPVRGEARIVPLGSTKGEWLKLAGEPERNFSPGESHQFTVRIAVPAETPAGRYSFRLNMVAVHDPEGDYTEGPTVSFEQRELVVAEKGGKGFPWWVVILAVVLVVGGAAIAFILMPSKVTVPALVGQTFLEASNTVQQLNLTLASTTEMITKTNSPGTVVNQDPQAGVKVFKGASIHLIVEGRPALVKVPDLSSRKNLTVDSAINSLLSARLRPAPIKQQPTTQTQVWGKVVAQSPKPGQEVESESEVELTVATKKQAVLEGIFVSPEVLKRMESMRVNTNRVFRLEGVPR